MRFSTVFTIAALFAASEARCFTDTCRDGKTRYATCTLKRDRAAPRAKRVYPRGTIVAEQATHTDAISFWVEIDSLLSATAYTINILDIKDGTSTINKRTCAQSTASGSVTAPTAVVTALFTGTTTSAGNFAGATATSSSFDLHRD